MYSFRPYSNICENLFNKPIIFLILLILKSFPVDVMAQELPYKSGEELRFLIYYDAPLLGKVYAGKASLEIENSEEKKRGNTVFHAIGRGNSTGSFDFFYKIRDRFESWRC